METAHDNGLIFPQGMDRDQELFAFGTKMCHSLAYLASDTKACPAYESNEMAGMSAESWMGDVTEYVSMSGPTYPLPRSILRRIADTRRGPNIR